MAAYLVADVVKVSNPDLYERYKALVPPTLRTHGAEYMARSGRVTTLKGTWKPDRLVIVQFESVEHAVEWWGCEQYRDAREMRQQAAATNMIVIEGVVPSSGRPGQEP